MSDAPDTHPDEVVEDGVVVGWENWPTDAHPGPQPFGEAEVVYPTAPDEPEPEPKFTGTDDDEDDDEDF